MDDISSHSGHVRVRFAPSPSGFLHVGGARTALFNWLFARSQGGKFFLRIEDTDRSRSTDEAILAIIDGMKWLGLDWDRWEGAVSDPPRQSDRIERYRQKVEELLNAGQAYPCYCSPDELEARRSAALAEGKTPRYDGRCRKIRGGPPLSTRPAAIRFTASSEGTITIEDGVKGKVVFDSAVVDDMIILRSDKTPTYNFCVVVDDVDMKITHVIRGDDHLNNTPRQIQLYQAMGVPIPKFAHLSMILGADKARLSKRHGATAVQQYRDEGYLPEAMVNYLVRLGWSHQDQELFTQDELMKTFSMDAVGVSAAIFNPDKLLWVNAHHIKRTDTIRLTCLLIPYLERQGIATDRLEPTRLARIVVAMRERSRTLKEMAESVAYFYSDSIVLDEKAEALLDTTVLPILKIALETLEQIDFEHPALDHAFRAMAEGLGMKLAMVAQPVRAAVTGKTVSPGIFDLLELMGKEKSLGRIRGQIQRISEKG